MFKIILSCLIGVAISFASVEAGTRILAELLGISPYMKYDEQIGWTAEPGSTKHHKDAGMGFDVVYHINSEGFRGPSYDLRKPAGVYRILVLGDSLGFGWGISENKNFAMLLDDKLNNVEVVNLSLSGYGTDQEYLRFLKEGVAYNPDLVIVQVTHNDFEEIMYPFFNQKPKPQFLVTEEGALKLANVPVRPVGGRCQEFYDNSLPLPFKEWLGWHSYSYNLFNEKYFALKRKTSRSPSAVPAKEVLSRESRTLFKKIISQLKNKLDEIGAKGIIVYSSKDLNEDGQFADIDLPTVNLYPQFVEHSSKYSRELFFKDGFHWNEEGHRLVADALTGIIAKYRP